MSSKRFKQMFSTIKEGLLIEINNQGRIYDWVRKLFEIHVIMVLTAVGCTLGKIC